jgi:hypothetical protein
MAITSARVVDPRDLVLVWTSDPSVGGDAGQLEKYRETGDISHLTLDGKETKFHIRLLDGRAWQLCREAAARYEENGAAGLSMITRAFELGVKRISNWQGADGVLRDLPRTRWLDELPSICRDEIGLMIFHLSRQGEDQGAGAVPLS